MGIGVSDVLCQQFRHRRMNVGAAVSYFMYCLSELFRGGILQHVARCSAAQGVEQVFGFGEHRENDDVGVGEILGDLFAGNQAALARWH